MMTLGRGKKSCFFIILTRHGDGTSRFLRVVDFENVIGIGFLHFLGSDAVGVMLLFKRSFP